MRVLNWMSKINSNQAGSSLQGLSDVAASSATIHSACAATSAPIDPGNFLRECGPAASISSTGLRRATLKQITTDRRRVESSGLSQEAARLLNEMKDELYSRNFEILLRSHRGVDGVVFARVLESVAAFAEAEHLAGNNLPSALTLLRQWSPVTEFLSEDQQRRLFQILMDGFPEASLDDVDQGMDGNDQFGRLLFLLLTSGQSRNAVIQHENLFFDLLRQQPSLLVDHWSILTKSMKKESFARMVIEGMVRVREDYPDYFNDWMAVLHRIHEVNYGSRLHPVFVRCLQEAGSEVSDVLLFTSDPSALKRGGFKSQRSAECAICGCTE